MTPHYFNHQLGTPHYILAIQVERRRRVARVEHGNRLHALVT